MPDRSVLAIVDSRNEHGAAVARAAVLQALDHFRAPRGIVDIANADIASHLEKPPAAIVIGQPGIADGLSAADVEAIRRAVQSGVGLLNLDGEFAARHPGLFEPVMSGVSPTACEIDAALTTTADHFIVRNRRIARLPFTKPVRTWVGPACSDAALLLEDDAGAPLVIAGAAGRGRIVHFCCSPELWTFDHLGHCCGLDDVFWRGLVWVARKPFAMMAMPPFVTVRIDDASGSGSIFAVCRDSAARRFDYIDELNHHGFIPNVGLFVDDIVDEDGAVLNAKSASREAQFSPHAFSDPKNIAEFQIYMRHDGTEYSEDELRENFARVDAKFAQWDVTPSRTLNCHFYECGVNALPFIRERGWMNMMTEVRFGVGYQDERARDWFPRPYGHFGYILDQMPDHPDFFTALAQYERPRGLMEPGGFDFLGGKTVFWGESMHNNIRGAIDHGAAHIGRGLDSLVFGVLMTHEQRIASMGIDEWRAILHGIVRELEGDEKIFVPYDEVSEYARARHGVDLAGATYREGDGTLECAIVGEVDRELMVHVFTEEEGEVVRTFHRLPAGKDVVYQVRV
jgi:hypothetical protein